MPINTTNNATGSTCAQLSLFLILLTCIDRSRAEEAQAPPKLQDNEIESKLYLFSQSSILYDRGVARCLFIESTDKWIRDFLLDDDRIVRAINRSGDTSRFLSDESHPPDSSTELSAIPNSHLLNFMERKSHRDLFVGLTEKEQRRIPGLYLRIEGLMALARPEFKRLFDDTQTQHKIQSVSIKYLASALELRKALSSKEMHATLLPAYLVELRKISANLDLQILLILNANERRRLFEILDASRTLDEPRLLPPVEFPAQQ